ncbi:MAG: F0F1 ATP synthase subunit B [Calditrichaceae bacterium]|nr:F0F1 ATP synthase subunit B [Calditrichaceae bacterium]MBN2707522.1 F0F1 ATP synthase subunit B [Calditrichaceae bacterium]RQV95611.1 MAG: ATP synthase F0 subunit B [Calditrichota bacterium]
MLDLNPGMILWTWITFFAVFIVLYLVALKPMLTAITNREQGIKNDLESAQKQREEAEAILEEHRRLMAKADEDGQKIIRENQLLAEKTKQDILESARNESDKMIHQAKEEIEREKQSALNSLRAEVADLAINAAEQIIMQNLDQEKQKKVVDEYLKSMPKSLNN